MQCCLLCAIHCTLNECATEGCPAEVGFLISSSVNKGYNENMSALEELSTNESQTRGSRIEAEGFLIKFQHLKVVILLELWDTVLERFQISEFQYYEEKGMEKSVVKEYEQFSNVKKKEETSI